MRLTRPEFDAHFLQFVDDPEAVAFVDRAMRIASDPNAVVDAERSDARLMQSLVDIVRSAIDVERGLKMLDARPELLAELNAAHPLAVVVLLCADWDPSATDARERAQEKLSDPKFAALVRLAAFVDGAATTAETL